MAFGSNDIESQFILFPSKLTLVRLWSQLTAHDTTSQSLTSSETLKVALAMTHNDRTLLGKRTRKLEANLQTNPHFLGQIFPTNRQVVFLHQDYL